MSYSTQVATRKFVAPVEIINFGPGFQPDLRQVPSLPNADVIRLRQYHSDFSTLFSQSPTYSLLLTSADASKNPFFHGACAYLAERDELYITSDLLQPADSSKLPTILISRVTLERPHAPASLDICTLKWMKLRPPQTMTMPVGAIPYQHGVLYCSQGTLAPESGGLWHMPSGKPPVPVLTQFFNKPFNSIQNVTQDREGGLWFTDSDVGFELELRPKPQLPNQVYRFDPKTRSLRVVADGFARPTGITLSPDESTIYITDTGKSYLGGKLDTRANAIYAYDVITRHNTPFLTNKRIFAVALAGAPTGLACDPMGNVYAACEDGVEIWSPAGVALGLIEMLGGCSSLCFGRHGELFICAKQRLWMIQLERSKDISPTSGQMEA
ncbi:calcium-dependent phosphotriesterase [Biscogniauxia mediterranea]|nr:calcium-dependent phosphotriesterase [Biscogniauxia mediterranea]